jgi:hypothetical protein
MEGMTSTGEQRLLQKKTSLIEKKSAKRNSEAFTECTIKEKQAATRVYSRDEHSQREDCTAYPVVHRSS